MRKLTVDLNEAGIAWQGGSQPRKRNEISRQEKDFITLFFRRQCFDF